MHGTTFMGNALACSASNASLDLFEKYDYEKMVNKIEVFFQNNLSKFNKYFAYKEKLESAKSL